MMDIKQEIQQLRAELERHNQLYYVNDAPEISDFEYDAMLRRLEDLEQAHPEYYDPNSPTQHVGGYALNTFAQVTHEVPLESLRVRSLRSGRAYAVQRSQKIKPSW